MAKDKKGFYAQNVVKVKIGGKEYDVNKYEAEALKKKLAANSKSK